MEKIIIETEDKSKLDLVKAMLEAMHIGFEVVSKDVVVKNKVLSDITDGYLEARDMEAGKVEYKSYSSFSEMEDDL
ncbi:hypothetical protein [Algoriphagus aquimarinus]|uniref:Uncharacterized protein n=1 Tax=Algoriphagus aquimarinus TaxID=237018 RepID=A0A1I0WGR6_9BACT|nr:hypothetical protein [Algoriphagus aquimarinus]SFA87320.1 hypothetical protein SAMN04489723_102107 [Algoriphagus aquimarinus]